MRYPIRILLVTANGGPFTSDLPASSPSAPTTLLLNAVTGGLIGLGAGLGTAHYCNTAGDYKVPYDRNWRRYVNENGYTD